MRLAITGMTCASCSARIERRLAKIDGIASASVNLATEKALVSFTAPVTAQQIVAEVGKTGYGATVLGGSEAFQARPDAGGELEGLGSASTTETGGGGPADAAHPVRGSVNERVVTTVVGSLAAAATALSRRAGGLSLTAPQSDRVAAATPAQPAGSAEHAEWAASRPHENHTGHVSAQNRIRPRLIGAVALTVPVFLLAMVIPSFGAGGWLELVLASPVVLWCAWPFHRAAAVNARHLASTMDTLVSIGVLAAYGYSIAALLTGGSHLYFEVAAVVTTFLLAGRFLEARAKDSGKDALRALLDLGAKDVAVLRIDPTTRVTGETRIPIDDLVVGDRFIVRPGEKVASDGVVSDGQSAVDASLVTGESTPVEVCAGDPVTGGSINTNGRLVVETTRVGSETVLAGIQRLVENAQTGKAQVQRLADRVSAVFVPAVLVIALVTFVAWLATGHELSQALAVAVTVLIIACPAPWPGHPDGAARGHRPRGAAGHPDQGTPGAREHPPHRHDRARQDGHRDDRAPEPGQHRGARAPVEEGRPHGGGGRRERQRAPDRPRDRGRSPAGPPHPAADP